jgi:hypothetical protein
MTSEEIRKMVRAAGEAMLDTLGRRNRKHADRECAFCGSIFRPKRADSSYCSVPCARKKNGGHNRKPEVWWTNSRGYVEGAVWVDGVRVRKKYHRHLMEIHLGRCLAPDEDIHHINGDKSDNRIENLQVILHSEHTRLTNEKRWSQNG